MGRNQNRTETLTEDRLAKQRSERIVEYTKRKRPYDYVKVQSSAVESFKLEGWEFDRELKTGIRLRKAKTQDEILENRFWSVLYLLGYKELNVGRHFKLTVTIDGKKANKQIDVLGIDETTVVVAECKSAESLKKKSLQSSLSDLDSLKRPIANAIRGYLGKDNNPKFIWCMVTSRIRWIESDLTRAREKQIQVVREQELRYFLEIAKTLGPAAKSQFEAEFLGGQKILLLSNRYVAASRFKLGGRFAYYFTIPAKELLRRSFVNHRDLRDPELPPINGSLVRAYSRSRRFFGFRRIFC